jgi:hypothetical protein
MKEPNDELPKTWRLRIATADVKKSIITPFKTYNNQTNSWEIRDTFDDKQLYQAVVIFI